MILFLDIDKNEKELITLTDDDLQELRRFKRRGHKIVFLSSKSEEEIPDSLKLLFDCQVFDDGSLIMTPEETIYRSTLSTTSKEEIINLSRKYKINFGYQNNHKYYVYDFDGIFDEMNERGNEPIRNRSSKTFMEDTVNKIFGFKEGKYQKFIDKVCSRCNLICKDIDNNWFEIVNPNIDKRYAENYCKVWLKDKGDTSKFVAVYGTYETDARIFGGSHFSAVTFEEGKELKYPVTNVVKNVKDFIKFLLQDSLISPK